jgi:hypothetical protein
MLDDLAKSLRKRTEGEIHHLLKAGASGVSGVD